MTAHDSGEPGHTPPDRAPDAAPPGSPREPSQGSPQVGGPAAPQPGGFGSSSTQPSPGAFGPPAAQFPPGAPPATPAPVPAGPGVRPPFAAPPVRKEPGKLALWLILGGLGLLLCLVGGGVGIGGALISAFNDTDQEARATVREYLDALREEQYGQAYRMTCRAHRKEVSEASFTDRKRGSGRIDAYELETIQAVEAPGSSQEQPETAYVVPAKLHFDDGSVDQRYILVVREPLRDPEPGEDAGDAEFGFRVCGEQSRRPAPTPT